ncbi:hypothetical protein Vretimale_8174 [Volvox reticuliferus]|uniref:Protein FRA10AC1 n=1 Tax=Volvox reticuliferus TaxID=1737510 RepID=A0A8J4CQ00_9CHLO|nr:hypothetical protein Vretifemale_11765 [Volvox reticuliferus]GIM03674.1 hypothetical protein Vretimale_8174 [Volvox reticuliferus]
MAQLGDLRRAAFGRVQSSQYYRSNFMGMTAVERHKKLLNDYLTYYARESDELFGKNESGPIRTDADALREHHRFIRSDADNNDASWEARLAKRYYDRLFKEYAIVDLSFYKQSKLGMRWRTEKEVMSGKGQFICGAKGCEANDGLCSYEVNFAYQEAGVRKQALVKLRVCPSCAFKLNYRKEKQLQKADAAAARKRKRGQELEEQEPKDPLVREALEYVHRYVQHGSEVGPAVARMKGMASVDLDLAAGNVAPPPSAAAAMVAGAAKEYGRKETCESRGAGTSTDGTQPVPGMITLPADKRVEESKLAKEMMSAEEMDVYFEGLFL